MAEFSGNKGEWSEVYVFLRLLESGKLYAADANMKRKANNSYFPVKEIYRAETQDKKAVYTITDDNVIVFVNDALKKSIKTTALKKYAEQIFAGILGGSESSFSIPGAEKIMDDILCTKLKAPSEKKADILLKIHDMQTGVDQISGFSIKSELGHAPTLLNASDATNFVYRVTGLSDSDIDNINAIDTHRKIMDRIDEIRRKTATFEYVGLANDTFFGNLMHIDSMMDQILAEMVKISYFENKLDMIQLVDELERGNFLDFPRKGIYRYKIKKFLSSIALGMMPSVEWNGRDEANGGYIVATETGDVLAFHIYNRDDFEDYLLKNTKLERASSKRHNYCNVFKFEDEPDECYIKLNLQIRFIK